jgi:NAD(P)-dependent dehydrogenase (short-subunit alcohol dehydrogenase family)
VESFECDVTSDEAISKLADALKSEVGYLDVLVINAGVATRPVQRPDGSIDWPRDVGELDLADFRRTFDVNFFAVVAALKFCLPLLEAAGKVERKGDGQVEWRSPQSVIVITSSSIHHYDPKLMAMGYALSKFTAARMSEFTHEGHKERGVCSFAIQPGGVMTGRF